MMQMTYSEIVKSYQEAKDKNAQIGILAELNAVTPEYIKEILKKNGAFKKPGPKPKLEATFKKDEPEKSKPKKAAVINKDFDDEVQKMIKESDKEEPAGCIRRRTGSCEGCDETDLCFEYIPKGLEQAKKRTSMPDIVKDAVCLGIEALDEKIKARENNIEATKKAIEELKAKKKAIEEYMKGII